MWLCSGTYAKPQLADRIEAEINYLRDRKEAWKSLVDTFAP